MKLKDIDGLLPMKIKTSGVYISRQQKEADNEATIYNIAIKEIGEKEIEIDVEKVQKVIFTGVPLKDLAQAIAKECPIRRKK